MKNIVLFGGAFDPIHNGHINMAIKASQELEADVFFIPARVSVWKNESLDIEHKIKMIELAIKESGREDILHISRVEADSKEEVNYSYLTVRKFIALYPDSKLYLLIGTDQVNSFEQWREADEIAQNTQIVYFSRPRLKLNEDNIERFKMVEIKGDPVDTSSTDIRNLKSLDVPYSVIRYIIENNLYFVKRLKAYLSIERYNHSVSVAETAYDIAKSNNLPDLGKYYQTALLHDLGKAVVIDQQEAYVHALYPEYLNLPKPIYHQFVGAKIAKEEFGIEDEDILEAIRFHTTGKANMSPLAIIVYSADKIEPTRGFDSSDLIQAMKVNYITGFSTVLKDNRRYYEANMVPYQNELTNACMKQYILD